MNRHDELDANLRRLLNPSGDRQYAAVRAEALEYLLQHADEGHARLLDLLASGSASVVAVAVLPAFGRRDSIPALEKLLLEADDPTVVAAADALGRHPLPDAVAALERALLAPRNQVVASAADALAVRGDTSACGALKNALAHPDLDVRVRIRAAADRLGCPA